MASFGATKNGGADVALRYALYVAATAGGSGDAAAANGGWIDRRGFNWLKAGVAYRAVLGVGQTLSLAAKIQDADDSSGAGAADFGTAMANAVVATGGSGGTTETGVAEIDLDLTMARPWIRLVATPDLNRANTDTAVITGQIALGGKDGFNPVSARANPAEPLG